MVKNPPANAETQKTWIEFLGQEDPSHRKGQLTPVFLPGEFRRQWSLVVYSPLGHEELDTIEHARTCQPCPPPNNEPHTF